MKKHILLSLLGLAAMITLFTSCDPWEQPIFPGPGSISIYDGPANNKTIADIKAMHVLGSGSQDAICGDDETFIVKAVVVSSDQGGNCYKYMTIQDETGGIEIAIDRTGIYNEYPVGQTIFLDCRGLIVGDYHNKYQIGWKYSGSVGRINANALDRYIHKNGLPNPSHPLIAHPITIKGSNDLKPENTNCLVKINGCKFDSKYHGLPLADDNFTMDREIIIGGATVIVRTSNYANFRSTTIDANKEYCLYGILTTYNDEYQLTLRTKEDIQDAQNEEDLTLQELSFNSSSLTSGGWTSYPSNGWTYQVFQGDDIMFHNSTSSTCDDWLISPEISISDLSGLQLFLEHKNNVEGSPADYYQVYYSTTYDGDFQESDWHAFNPNLNVFPSNFGLSNGLDLSVIDDANFRIALRYHKNGSVNGARWYVHKLKIAIPSK